MLELVGLQVTVVPVARISSDYDPRTGRLIRSAVKERTVKRMPTVVCIVIYCQHKHCLQHSNLLEFGQIDYSHSHSNRFEIYKAYST